MNVVSYLAVKLMADMIFEEDYDNDGEMMMMMMMMMIMMMTMVNRNTFILSRGLCRVSADEQKKIDGAVK